uniref:Uncharacterized protein n=1 Tax=Ditylenchus dipsaci TaxID=166011 RepID=A0A915EGN9_9BILA
MSKNTHLHLKKMRSSPNKPSNRGAPKRKTIACCSPQKVVVFLNRLPQQCTKEEVEEQKKKIHRWCHTAHEQSIHLPRPHHYCPACC